MKLNRCILLAVLLTAVLALSACFESNAAERAQQEAYRQALETYQKQREEYNKQVEEYNRQQAEALDAYLKQWQQWQEQEQQQQIEKVIEAQ